MLHASGQGWELHHSDCIVWLRMLPDASVDAIVTDPPYELGFMGKSWDASGIACSVELWRQVLRVLKPGGHLLAFGGTRTYHRMACAIEDAGFEVRDCLMWIYGTGFPKSHNVGDGRGTALKPAHEPIVLARKPLIGTVAENVKRHGTGALNVDGCRIPGEPWTAHRATGLASVKYFSAGEAPVIDKTPHNAGRWPANVLLDEEAAEELDGQSGELQARGNKSASTSKGGTRSVAMSWVLTDHSSGPEYNHDSGGGASRFFYVAKASRAERGAGNIHPTVKPLKLMAYLVRLVTPPGGLVVDPFTGSGTTALAALSEGCRFMGCDLSAEYLDIATGRIAAQDGTKEAQAPLDLVAPA